MIPDDQLSFAALGCRGVLRLSLRAGYYRCCELASVPFLRVYQFMFERLARPLIFRFRTPMQGHEEAQRFFGWLDTHAPMWALNLVRDVAWGSYRRRGRLARDAARKTAELQRRMP